MSRFILIVLLINIFVINGTKAKEQQQHGAVNGRIVGGQETHITEHPYQVSVRLVTYTLLHICGGSIYAPRIIITAAHCIKGRYPSYLRIVVGESSILAETDVEESGLPVIKLIPHGEYKKKTHENDVGLIILAERLTYSLRVQPIPLASVRPAVGTYATITGWGRQAEDAKVLTNILQEVDVQIVDDGECSAKYLTNKLIINKTQMLCAGVPNGGKDSCQGDSGGPLTVNGYLVGIISWGVGCARSNFPGVYASVPYHMSWIKNNAQNYL